MCYYVYLNLFDHCRTLVAGNEDDFYEVLTANYFGCPCDEEVYIDFPKVYQPCEDNEIVVCQKCLHLVVQIGNITRDWIKSNNPADPKYVKSLETFIGRMDRLPEGFRRRIDAVDIESLAREENWSKQLEWLQSMSSWVEEQDKLVNDREGLKKEKQQIQGWLNQERAKEAIAKEMKLHLPEDGDAPSEDTR